MNAIHILILVEWSNKSYCRFAKDDLIVLQPQTGVILISTLILKRIVFV